MVVPRTRTSTKILALEATRIVPIRPPFLRIHGIHRLLKLATFEIRRLEFHSSLDDHVVTNIKTQIPREKQCEALIICCSSRKRKRREGNVEGFLHPRLNSASCPLHATHILEHTEPKNRNKQIRKEKRGGRCAKDCIHFWLQIKFRKPREGDDSELLHVQAPIPNSKPNFFFFFFFFSFLFWSSKRKSVEECHNFIGSDFWAHFPVLFLYINSVNEYLNEFQDE